jgi:Calcineurin-like phosphoesterase
MPFARRFQGCCARAKLVLFHRGNRRCSCVASNCQILIVSDIHYAGAAERARGDDYEYRDLKNPLQRHFVKNYRHYIWLRHPMRQNHLFEQFLERAGSPALVVANGDYSCDTGFVGMADDAALESARECLGKLRARFAPNFYATLGDHELGKVSFFGGRGGLRLASWERSNKELGLPGFWQVEMGNYVLMGVTSSILALPVLGPDTLAAERDGWNKLREQHFAEIRRAFATLKPDQRVILFCHDPTALPFLWHDDTVRARIGQIEHTIIGHLHSNLVLWKSRLLSGMPRIRFLGHTVNRLTHALSEARHWLPFNVLLCPSLSGVQLLKDGGYCTLELDLTAKAPAKFQFHRLRSSSHSN